jgi:hypothetical protein
MGNIFTNDVVTNAINGNAEIKNGSKVVHLDKTNGSISSDGGKSSDNFLDIENKLTNKFDEIDYYEIPSALHGGGITPTPSPTIPLTPSPTPSPTPTPTSLP